MNHFRNPTYRNVELVLAGTKGNRELLIDKAASAIRANVGAIEADQYAAEARQQPTYSDLLTFTMNTMWVR